jgi:flagellar basal body-associated protein FliL
LYNYTIGTVSKERVIKMNGKSHWITLAAVLIVIALIMTACELPGSIVQSTPGGGDSGQGEPAPEQPVEPPPEEAPVEEPAAPAPTQAPVDSTGNVTTSQGSQTGIVIVLLLILLIIGVIILFVVAQGRAGQSQPQAPAADAPPTPSSVDDSEPGDSQSD